MDQHRPERFGVVFILAVGLTLAFRLPAHAQGYPNCATAVQQLQAYVAQVNGFANNEFYFGIPGRCMGNPGCVQGSLWQLNSWYLQQSNMVNGWYGQIAQQCSAQPTGGGRLPTDPQTSDNPGKINDKPIEDLKVDDEDKTVRIKIPTTPRGYQ